jgi:UDP-glucose 4-epimerase
MYGNGEKGNFALIHKIARIPIPLPLGSLTAPRSVLSIENFNSAVDFVLAEPRALGETFIVSDPRELSVAEMISAYRLARGMRPNVFSVPSTWIERILMMLGRATAWQRLGAPLLAPPTKLLSMGWKPVASYVTSKLS